MSAFLVRLNPGRCGQTVFNKTDMVIVWADPDLTGVDPEDVEDVKADAARAAAAEALPGPGGQWSDADVTELTEANLATAIPAKAVN